jgi:hypothetical protein
MFLKDTIRPVFYQLSFKNHYDNATNTEADINLVRGNRMLSSYILFFERINALFLVL